MENKKPIIKLSDSVFTRCVLFIKDFFKTCLEFIENIGLQFIQVLIMIILAVAVNPRYGIGDYVKNVLIIYVVDSGFELSKNKNKGYSNIKYMLLIAAVVLYLIIELGIKIQHENTIYGVCLSIVIGHFLLKFFVDRGLK